ncbi:hypothetical protein DPM19_18010 [Actinomadura craniellae]|uniref:Alpha/beta hydrolase n=1 Tax=Actinomadura craniellae TaxID=2231787 RepID=A0A365H388_9ACTN|nr:hypothetical protein [Actinomadura craniellae]RAY13574.1 hypothetical protein DPM19_18010 [Actinomadura craniellae]
MTPGTLVLLHAPYATAAAWGELPELLRDQGLDVVAPDVRDGSGIRYVGRAALVIAATAPTPPLVLVGRGGAGPLLPAVAAAQRAAHRQVGAYVFFDAELPRPRRGHDHVPGVEQEPQVPADWPEAPCGYLRTADRYEQEARQAELRGWPVTRQQAPVSVPGRICRPLRELISAL